MWSPREISQWQRTSPETATWVSGSRLGASFRPMAAFDDLHAASATENSALVGNLIPQRQARAQRMRQLLEIHPTGAIARPAFLRRNLRWALGQCSPHLLQLCPSRHLLGE
jgi:hypothetical protein